MSSIMNIAIRGAQIFFAAVVTGLSINLAVGHHWGGLPITLGFVSFVGCASLLGAFIGLAGTWVDLLQGPIGMIIDGFIILINLAGGVLIAVKIKGINCTSSVQNLYKIGLNNLMNGGCKKDECYYWYQPNGDSIVVSRCKQNQADAAFMFLTVIVLLVGLVLGFLRMKKGY